MGEAGIPGIEVDLDGKSLAAVQLERLQATLRHAYANNAHYRRSFDEAGVHPDDLLSLDDLQRFPFVTKDDLRQNYPFGFFCVPMDKVARVHASSGTTGKPTVVGYTRSDLDTWGMLIGRSLAAAGGKPGMRIHNAYGYGLFTGGLGVHFGAEMSGYTVIPISGGQTEKQVQLICDFEPDIIMVTPSYMLTILDEFKRQGIDPRSTSLKIGIFGAEPWTDSMRVEIERAFNLKAVDIYGLSEVMGPGVASEFAADQNGPTIWEDHFLAEIIDPQTGARLPDGELGELVFTSLTKEAMPIIRYRTRDLTRLLPGTSSQFRRLGRITGRSDDMLIIRGVNVFPTQIEEQLLRCESLTPHYEIEIARPKRMDEVLIRVEGRPEHTPAEHDAGARRLANMVKTSIGISAKIEVCTSGHLARSQGKLSRVKDLRLVQ
ncbi:MULTISPECIES: AMP-binding protein [unclassified Sphingobium]|uniref:AMP-binding protein n=1 Tax=unclassified Sphingobium TaxID=2611147 RepID=UPI00119AF512|nr:MULTISPECIES: AMP-binding protein [unclassified Sphingobium]MBG6120440.1 phenylacetate-CoA ligase [Sphingobium sp. JAI105]TWC98932.1 phenylacetate-CoA ligase [Sphingobium sp. AEW010]TWD18411.1 phenylacetate-CoA ligase [Sphingobium sp. AEW013]TWD21039.1 phenylacetate-CoA ligase [Sphingobium sp. AEW001]